ncbi:response regulator [Clostridiaceae bacterium UIB06]|uniref:Response regulator n=1 Tax=Clostridium thailandense TaxID=2794346 RepID=A0A949TXA4_9CLOT|nr:response regulator [Clostridium thailandense]MBV7273250.1 response regulator [Clostridium thailandense]MCH5137953.1 response regulator [Clostridiaceae bacterium UIB06]
MYKIILVDDEEEVRKGIINKIQWNKYGFEIIGEAENGREALEIAEKNVPDLVITDIKMPFMDGMELSEILSERFATVKIVILTGFDEFEYAKTAIKLNVIEYILKPISSNDIIKLLINVKERLDKEFQEKKDMKFFEELYHKSLPILREKFLSSIIRGNIDIDEIIEKEKNYNISLEGETFLISIIAIDYKLENIESKDKEIIIFKVLNLCEEIINKYCAGLVFIEEGNIVILSISQEKDKKLMLQKTTKILEEIKQSVDKYLKLNITIGIGTSCEDIEGVSISYKNAVAALDYRIILGNNRIIFIDDIEPKRENEIVFDKLKERQLESCIKTGTKEEIYSTVEDIFKVIEASRASIEHYQIYLIQIVTIIIKISKDSSVDIADIFGEKFNFFIELDKFSTLVEVKNWIKKISIKISEHIIKGREDLSKLLVDNAKEYIEERYQDVDININTICNYLHISQAYFSYIFKKDTKTTFVSYLTQIRMEKAKELLRNTNLKTFIIAEKVGFSEPNYFSYCFKKNLGQSPSEYRNSFKNIK